MIPELLHAKYRGRKRACVTYCVTYILSCVTKHSPQYKVLMLGRVLGGIATSLLFSAFESWLVAEHNKVCNCYTVKPALFKLVVVTIIFGFI